MYISISQKSQSYTLIVYLQKTYSQTTKKKSFNMTFIYMSHLQTVQNIYMSRLYVQSYILLVLYLLFSIYLCIICFILHIDKPSRKQSNSLNKFGNAQLFHCPHPLQYKASMSKKIFNIVCLSNRFGFGFFFVCCYCLFRRL